MQFDHNGPISMVYQAIFILRHEKLINDKILIIKNYKYQLFRYSK